MNAKATITRIFGATKSDKNGNFYLAAQATMSTGESVLGTGVESNCLVNISLTSIGEGIASLLKQDELNPNRFVAIDSETPLDFTVELRDVRAHAEKENTYWATV